MRALPFPVLVGDIGGTNARFALVSEDGAPAPLPRVLTAAYPGPLEAMRAALAAGAERPRSALLAVAAPVEGPVVPLTNAPWVVDGKAVVAGLGLHRVVLVNDYVPVAAALAELGADDPRMERIGPALAFAAGPKVVLGPGTGLGAAALVPAGGRLVVVSTEAGHMEFGPANVEEEVLWRGIERVGGRVAAEQILSGPGLVRLYRAVAAAGGGGAILRDPAAIAAAAMEGADPLSRRTLGVFAGLLGRFAGDLALAFGATGGVMLAGAMACGMAPVLSSSPFRESFDNKAPHGGFMRRIPTSLLRDPDPALIGLAAIAAEPGRFAFASHTVER